jgi:hypothetical protein
MFSQLLVCFSPFNNMKKTKKKEFLYNLDIELFPNDDGTTKETYKQRFFQLINNSEVKKTNIKYLKL